MTTPENPWDQTIWDPAHPEHAIEDPFHGSESLMRRLSTPPMPMPDGSWHVFGGYDQVGTCDFDQYGKPFIKFKTLSSSPVEIVSDMKRIEDWHKTLAEDGLPEGYPEPSFFDLTTPPYFIVDQLENTLNPTKRAPGDPLLTDIGFLLEDEASPIPELPIFPVDPETSPNQQELRFRQRFMRRLLQDHSDLGSNRLGQPRDLEDPMMRTALWQIMELRDMRKAHGHGNA